MRVFQKIKIFFNYLVLKFLGVKVGKSVKIMGKIDIVLRDGAKYSNIEIEDNVVIEGDLIVRNRKNGRVIIGNNVSVGRDVWFVCANSASLTIEDHVKIGSYAILNGGHGIKIKKYSWLAAFVYISSSDHRYKKGELIQEQGYFGNSIEIGEDCWIGGQVFIAKGVKIGNGCVIGAGSIVTKSFQDNVVIAGNPAYVLKYRE